MNIKFEKLVDYCKYYHPAFDINHECIATCRMPEMKPSGASWGECREDKCPLAAMDNGENIYCDKVTFTKMQESGHWEYWTPDGVVYPIYRCSICQRANVQPTRYCPYCGARMWGDYNG